MVRARNDGEQGKRCGLAGQGGPKSFAAAFLNSLSENVLLCGILAVVWRRCWYTEAGNVSQRRQTQVNEGPSRRILQGGSLFTVRMHAVKRRWAVKGLVCSRFVPRNKVSQWQFLRKVWMWRTVSPVNTVGTLLLLLLLLFCEAKDSLPAKNLVELRSNDVGSTVGQRALIPGKV